MKDIIWKLFKETGDIKYFMLLNKLEESDKDDRRSRRNSAK